MPPETKAHIVQLSLLGLATAADFEIRVAGLVGAGPGKEALLTEPALAPIDPTIIQCFYGADEDDTACQFLQGKAEVIRTAGGHHSTVTMMRWLDEFSTAFVSAPVLRETVTNLVDANVSRSRCV